MHLLRVRRRRSPRAGRAVSAPRDELFRAHPESPIVEAKRAPHGPGSRWYPYDPAWRVTGVDPAASPSAARSRSRSPPTACCAARAWAACNSRCRARRHARDVLARRLRRRPVAAVLRRDERRRAPTAAGAISTTRSRAPTSAFPSATIVLDFNFAYNPSCAYDERWSCPLSPPENRLPFAVEAGERV